MWYGVDGDALIGVAVRIDYRTNYLIVAVYRRKLPSNNWFVLR